MTQAANLSALGSNVTTSGNLSSASTLSLQTNSTTAVTINASQNVGIGTTTPTEKLEMTGGDFKIGTGRTIPATTGGEIISGNGLNNDIVTTGRVAAITGGWGSLRIHQTAAYDGLALIGDTSQTASYMRVESSTGATIMKIDSSGNVAIGGTYSSGGKLNVNGNSSTISPVYVNDAATGSASQFLFYFVRNGSNVGSIQTTGTATSYVTSSDYRLKENIVPMTGALDKVAQLKPVTYTWKSDGSDGQGFIAHELQEIVPNAVTGEKDAVDEEGNPVYQGIDTSFLVATLTAAIQEQQAIIETLKADIAELKAKVK